MYLFPRLLVNCMYSKHVLINKIEMKIILNGAIYLSTKEVEFIQGSSEEMEEAICVHSPSPHIQMCKGLL